MIYEKIIVLSIMLIVEIACVIISANETYYAYKKNKLLCIASIFPILFFSLACGGVIWIMINFI